MDFLYSRIKESEHVKPGFYCRIDEIELVIPGFTVGLRKLNW